MAKPLQIFIGYDSKETVAYHVLVHSIMRHASGPVSITPLIQSQLRDAGLYLRERGPTESTEFSMTRFLVPHLCGFGDYALFLDCDMLCQGDVYDLVKIAKADELRAVWCVKHDYTPKTTTKFLGQQQTVYPRKNWSSVMLFRNKYCERLTTGYVNSASGIDLHRMTWAGVNQNIGDLPIEWNWLVGEYEQKPDAKMLHYTLGTPCFADYANCEQSDLWWMEYERMMLPVQRVRR
jgi:lipopolysaccharide biosynthesis glycosyltransferase